MRKLIVAAALVLVLAAGPAAAVSGPAQVLQKQLTLLQAGNTRAAYLLFTENFRTTCDYETWSGKLGDSRSAFAGLSFRVLTTKIKGGVAKLTYQVKRENKILETVRDDVYVKIGGKWYDELDSVTTCG